MSGKVPAEDMTQARLEVMAKIEAVTEGKGPEEQKSYPKSLLAQALPLLEECPRTSCAYCEHIARSEAERNKEVLQGE